MIHGKLKLTLASVLAALLLAAQGNAVPLTTGADFLLMTTGARPDAMGQAFSAVADDINTLSFNPAGLGNIRLPEVGYGHETFPGDLNFDFVGAAIPVGVAGVLGLGFVNLGTTPFNSTANPAAPLVTAQDMALIGGWGKSFYDFQVGGAVKYITRQLDTVSGNGLGFDVGARYRLFPWLTFAASGMNIGPGIQLAGMEPLPTLINTGVAWTVMEQPSATLNLAANAAFNVTTNTQQVGFGAEYWYKNTVALRAGYLANSFDTAFNSDGFAAGAGVQVSFIQLDYAFQPFNTLGMVHRVSGILRWDGPWVEGGEPNAPKYLSVRQVKGALEIRWEKAKGPVESYEVLIQPLDGSDMIVSRPVLNPPYIFSGIDSETLYKVALRSIGRGGARSFASDETYFMSEYTLNRIGGGRVQEPWAGKPSISIGVTGRPAGAGLELSWDAPKGAKPAGYNLYRKSPQGKVEKVTLEPKADKRVWLADTSGLGGWEWIVTAMSADGRGERTVGTYTWYPSPLELEAVAENPVIHLNASPQPKHMVFLDWDKVNGASGYTLFVSRKADGVYEYLMDVSANKATVLLKTPRKSDKYFFVIVPKDASGAWMKRSNEVKVELFADK